MATTRHALGSVLGTVVTTAETLNGALNAASRGIGMLNAFVEKAATEQEGRHKNDAALFKTQLVIEGAQAEAEMNMEVVRYCKKSSEHAQLFSKSYEKFAKLHGLKIEDDEFAPHLRVAAE